MSPPLFSIITVTYNSADNLAHTLRSVAEQTSPYYEHIIIDGASTDHTRKVVAENPNIHMRFTSAPDKGIYDAMNKGLAEAKGEYVIFLNAGDTFHSASILEQITDIAMENDFPGVIYGQTDLVDSNRTRVGSRHLTAPENLTYRSFADGMVVCHQAFVALRRITGEFDMRYHFSADYEWCIRVLQHSRHNVMLPGVMIDYLNEGATTRNRTRSLMERFRIMCYFYGTVPTVGRHFGFLLRALRRRLRTR
ncbi:MAG: glycosyltransferase [Bacteroidales bacterium]|nr:glycosyltransferase [Bacteroidales bacterium]